MTALYIILGILAFFIGLLSIPVAVRVEYADSVNVCVKWLFLKLQLVPGKEKKKKKKEKKKKEDEPKEDKPKEEKPKEPNVLQRFYEYQGIPGFIELLRRTVAAMKKFRHGLWLCFCIRELNFAMTLPGGDPEALAFQYGKLSAAIFPSLGWLCGKLRTRKGKIKANIYPDFTGTSPRQISCIAEVGVVPSVLIAALLGLVVRLGVKVGLKFLKGTKPPKENNRRSDNLSPAHATINNIST